MFNEVYRVRSRNAAPAAVLDAVNLWKKFYLSCTDEEVAARFGRFQNRFLQESEQYFFFPGQAAKNCPHWGVGQRRTLPANSGSRSTSHKSNTGFVITAPTRVGWRATLAARLSFSLEKALVRLPSWIARSTALTTASARVFWSSWVEFKAFCPRLTFGFAEFRNASKESRNARSRLGKSRGRTLRRRGTRP